MLVVQHVPAHAAHKPRKQEQRTACLKGKGDFIQATKCNLSNKKSSPMMLVMPKGKAKDCEKSEELPHTIANSTIFFRDIRRKNTTALSQNPFAHQPMNRITPLGIQQLLKGFW